MSHAFWQAIATTHWWNVVIVLALLSLGLEVRKPRYIRQKDLIIFPTLFTLIGLGGLFATRPISLNDMLVWIDMLSLGIGLGFLHFRLLRIQVDSHSGQIRLPGSLSLLVILMLLTLVKYAFSLQISYNLPFFMDARHTWIILIPYGLMSGLFVGRYMYTKVVVRTSTSLS